MDFPVTRLELSRISGISRTMSYELQAKRVLTPPSLWFGRRVFCLRLALGELCRASGLEVPTEATLALHWQLILSLRCKR
jgi:hypothetical protein